MTCEVKIIEDSLNPYNDVRLTSFQLRYWRAIHSEVLTHRVFSRSASSSRALPVNRMINQVWKSPAEPIFWGKNQKGMQSYEELGDIKKFILKNSWRLSGKLMASIVWILNNTINPHKQILNRLLEPWQYISVIMTGTEWDNFFNLRDHHAAEPNIQELARSMREAYNNSIPEKRYYHLPYITLKERAENESIENLMRISTARCARVSYLNHYGKVPNILEDLQLYERLVGSVPIHASPSEHCAYAISGDNFIKNFRGWEQHRVSIEESKNIGGLKKR